MRLLLAFLLMVPTIGAVDSPAPPTLPAAAVYSPGPPRPPEAVQPIAKLQGPTTVAAGGTAFYRTTGSLGEAFSWAVWPETSRGKFLALVEEKSGARVGVYFSDVPEFAVICFLSVSGTNVDVAPLPLQVGGSVTPVPPPVPPGPTPPPVPSLYPYVWLVVIDDGGGTYAQRNTIGDIAWWENLEAAGKIRWKRYATTDPIAIANGHVAKAATVGKPPVLLVLGPNGEKCGGDCVLPGKAEIETIIKKLTGK